MGGEFNQQVLISDSMQPSWKQLLTCNLTALVPWHGCRRQQLHEHDMVNQLQLSSFSRSKVQQAAQIHGQSFSHAMQGIDSTISQQLQRMIAS